MGWEGNFLFWLAQHKSQGVKRKKKKGGKIPPPLIILLASFYYIY
jgi:hypothetical protein